jgi:predicted Zn-dependent protease
LEDNSQTKIPVTIKVLDSDDVDAMVLPGGFFFVNSGLILKAGSESELAGAMAHGIARIAARHGFRQVTRAAVSNFATIPLIFIGSWKCYDVRGTNSVLVPMGFRSVIRSFEAEADVLSLEYLHKSGFDPNAYADFFERVQAGEPLIGDRVKTAQKNIQDILPVKTDYVVTTSEFEDVQARLMAIRNQRSVTESDGETKRPILKRRASLGH